MNTPTEDADVPQEGAGGAHRRLLEKQLAAINAHDTSGFASCYAEDAVVIDPQYPEPLRGRGAIEQDVQTFFTAFPDLDMSITSVLAEGPSVAVEATMTGTHNGPLTLPTGEVPATGRRLRFPMAFFDRLNGEGLIVEERRYYDLATQQEQLGLG